MGILDQVRKEPPAHPPLLLVYGDPGIGKTTFAAQAPSPLFLLTEQGLGKNKVPSLDVKDVPTMEQALDELAITAEKKYKTVVIDSLGGLEDLVCTRVAHENNVESIGEMGHGRGHQLAQAVWSRLVRKIRAVHANGFCVIQIAHSETRDVVHPEAGRFTRWQIKLQRKNAALCYEHADAVLFISKIVRTVERDGEKIATGSDDRWIFAEDSPAYSAKNRWGLPKRMALSWSEFYRAWKEATK